MLNYIQHMSEVGLLTYSGFVTMCVRKDVRSYFKEELQATSNLYDQAVDVAVSKGIITRAPYISYPSSIDFIDSKSYLSGLSLFKKERPLNVIEISHLYKNIQTNLMGIMLSPSFAQTCHNNEIDKWLGRGRDISKKHIDIFTQVLLNNNIQSPMTSDNNITNSTTPVFSEKLMMFHISFLAGVGMGNYAAAAC